MFKPGDFVKIKEEKLICDVSYDWGRDTRKATHKYLHLKSFIFRVVREHTEHEGLFIIEVVWHNKFKCVHEDSCSWVENVYEKDSIVGAQYLFIADNLELTPYIYKCDLI